ncbi:MAG: hypothetical protein ACLSUW_05620 [Akkermansia sp.]
MSCWKAHRQDAERSAGAEDTARLLKRRVAVCHVLRYTQFYRTLKNHRQRGNRGSHHLQCQ